MAARSLAFEAIGTRWVIQPGQPIGDSAWQKLSEQIKVRIDQFDKIYSRFRTDSLVTTISHAPGTYPMPAEGLPLLRFYERLYVATDGQITPLIGQVMSDAGYDANYSLEPKSLQRPPLWPNVVSYDEQKLTVRQPVLLDFGAAGKGYLVDIVGELIQNAGVESFFINAGGDILCHSAGEESFQIGLENPADTSEIIGIIELKNGGLGASAANKRRWGQLHHIMNPATLRPAGRVAASWALADDAMTADGLATALMLVPPGKLTSEFSFSYATLADNGELTHHKNFPVKIFQTRAT